MRPAAYRHLLLCCAVTLSLCAVPATAAGLGPLSPDQRAILWGTAEDPAPEELGGINDDFKGRHYVAGDEFRLHLFAPKLRGLGGGYLGVGSDQAYVFIGWARPEIAWLTDYDPLVVSLHQAYRVFFLASPTADQFLQCWSAANSKASVALLREKLTGQAQKGAVAAFQQSRGLVALRLAKVKRGLKAAGEPGFLDDDAAYQHIRTLLQTDRIRPLSANLLADKGLAGVAAAATKLGVPIRGLYLSNAEEYWSYTPQFRKNIAGLPFGDGAMVWRTLSGFKKNGDYCYHVQTAVSFVGYLRHKVSKVFGIMRCGDKKEEDSLKLLYTDRVPVPRLVKRKG